MLPGIVTVVSIVLLFSSITNPTRFNFVLAGYLSFIGFYSIYRLCNKPKSWWLLLIPVIMIPLLFGLGIFNLFSLFFRDFILGKNALANIPRSFLPAFFFFFFAAGLLEELFKALPVLIMGWLGKAVKDPIDGILLGAASGVGFTLVETLGEYIPRTIQVGGDLSGLELLIPRILASVFGHMAYSQSLKELWKERTDFYAVGNLTTYYSPYQLKSEDFRGPDFFVVLGTEKKQRKSWVVWEEMGKYPNVIIEILSPTTATTDKNLKKEIYQDTFRTPNYFWFDPYSLELVGFHLVDGTYKGS